jgi:hypothetical protein
MGKCPGCAKGITSVNLEPISVRGGPLPAGCRAGTLCVSFPPVTAPPGTGEHGSVHPRSAVGSCAVCSGT